VSWGAAQLRGRPRPQNDTWIAACCLRYQVPLVTLNTADVSDCASGHGLVLLSEQW
jgi:toxin FitB